MSDTAQLLEPWLSIPLISVRKYLESRKVDYRSLALREKREFALLAQETAKRLNETIQDVQNVVTGSLGIDTLLAEGTVRFAAADETICAGCGIPNASSACGKCRTVRYCTKECQLHHWSIHKPICKTAALPPVPSNSLDVNTLSKRRPGKPLVFRGDRLFSALWDTLDPSQIAVPPSSVVEISTGGRSFRLTGPQTASQVLDAILKTERGENFSMIYAKNASDAVSGCDSCPRQGFCGIKLSHSKTDGVQVFEVLWSELFCHTGLSMMAEQVYHSKDFFSLAKGRTEAVTPVHTPIQAPASCAQQ